MNLGPYDVVIIYGGRSTEHEVSCKSAAFIYKNVRELGHRAYGIGIGKSGRWFIQNDSSIFDAGSGSLRVNEDQPLDRIFERRSESREEMEVHPAVQIFSRVIGSKDYRGTKIVVFPVIHGHGGEDGTLQGLLDYGEIPYVGPDVLGSAVGMDKVVAKRLVEAAGIKVVPSLDLKKSQWGEEAQRRVEIFANQNGWPIFIKPARLGSSVGVTKVKAALDVKVACERAFQYDDKILVEKGIKAREIEVGVLGGDNPQVSCPGEVVVHADFYSFEAKYQNKAASRSQVPALLTPQQTQEVQALARVCYQALDLYGMSRVDFFLDQDTNEFIFNEVNTIPGFTEISLFPMMWKHSGLDSKQLIEALIESALVRSELRSKLNRVKD